MENIILADCPDCGGMVRVYYVDGCPVGVDCPHCCKMVVFWDLVARNASIDDIVGCWNTHSMDENAEIITKEEETHETD